MFCTVLVSAVPVYHATVCCELLRTRSPPGWDQRQDVHALARVMLMGVSAVDLWTPRLRSFVSESPSHVEKLVIKAYGYYDNLRPR